MSNHDILVPKKCNINSFPAMQKDNGKTPIYIVKIVDSVMGKTRLSIET